MVIFHRPQTSTTTTTTRTTIVSEWFRSYITGCRLQTTSTTNSGQVPHIWHHNSSNPWVIITDLTNRPGWNCGEWPQGMFDQTKKSTCNSVLGTDISKIMSVQQVSLVWHGTKPSHMPNSFKRISLKMNCTPPNTRSQRGLASIISTIIFFGARIETLLIMVSYVIS